MSRSGFYAWKHRPVSHRRQYDEVLKAAIKELHQGFRRSYGAARVHQSLRRAGLSCSRRRINRLMRELGVNASSTGLYAWRPGHHEFYESAGNQLRDAGSPLGPGQQWAADFTYIKSNNGWLYHAVVMDLYSRRVVGWSFSRQRNAHLTMSALRMALDRETPESGCIFHSDQGIEYAAHDHRRMVEDGDLQRSMSRKGTPLDNAHMESYFHTLKAELVHQHKFRNDIEAVTRIIEYIEFYNQKRLHSSIDYQSPEEFERQCA